MRWLIELLVEYSSVSKLRVIYVISAFKCQIVCDKKSATASYSFCIKQHAIVPVSVKVCLYRTRPRLSSVREGRNKTN